MKIKFFLFILLFSDSIFASEFLRLDDSRLNFPIEWQECSSDNQCSTIAYGCTTTAVNKDFRRQAESNAWLLGGDPRTINCAFSDDGLVKLTRCENNRCGDFVRPINQK